MTSGKEGNLSNFAFIEAIGETRSNYSFRSRIAAQAVICLAFEIPVDNMIFQLQVARSIEIYGIEWEPLTSCGVCD